MQMTKIRGFRHDPAAHTRVLAGARTPGACRRSALLALALAALVLLCAGPAGAEEDLKSQLSALNEAVREHKKNDDDSQLKADLDTAVRLHAAAEENAAIQKKVVALMVGIGKGSSNDDLVRHMLVSLGTTKNEAAASTVKSYLRQKDRDKADDILLTAVQVAGTAPQSAYVESLLKLLEKSDHMGVAAKALESLGSYHDVKNKREKIVKVIIETVRKYKPGVKGNQKGMMPGEEASQTGEGSRSRWSSLAPIVPKALGRLTGNEMYGAKIEDWFVMYDENKRDLGELFIDS